MSHSRYMEEILSEVEVTLPLKVERSLFPRHKPWTGLTYAASPYTRHQFIEALRTSPLLRTAVSAVHDKVSAAAISFSAEIFARIFFPSTLKVAPTPETSWSAAYHQKLDVEVNFRRYQRVYCGDARGAGVVTQTLLEAFLRAIPDDVARSDHDPNGETPTLPGELERAGAQGNPDAESAIAKAIAEYEAWKAAQGDRSAAAQAASWDVQRALAGGLTGGSIAKALDKAVDQLREERDLFAGLGMPDDSKGAAVAGSPTVKAALANKLRNNRRLKQIALLAGRFRRIAENKQRGVKTSGWNEVSSVERGVDIPRVVPAQLVGLVESDLESLFDVNYAEKKLMQYRLESTPPKGRGPIVFCIDVSSSMRGDRDLWAKALFAGVAELALRQKRWCHAIQFNTNISREDSFDPAKPDPAHFLECVGHEPSGGTDFDPALRRAVEIIGSRKEFKKADIVFLTDGESYISDYVVHELREVQKTTPISVQGIIVGGDVEAGRSTLSAFCDEITALPDVLSAAVSTAEKLYAKMV